MEDKLYTNFNNLVSFRKEVEKLYEKGKTKQEITNIMYQFHNINSELTEELVKCDLIELDMIYKLVLKKVQKKCNINDIIQYFLIELRNIVSYIVNVEEESEIE